MAGGAQCRSAFPQATRERRTGTNRLLVRGQNLASHMSRNSRGVTMLGGGSSLSSRLSPVTSSAPFHWARATTKSSARSSSAVSGCRSAGSIEGAPTRQIWARRRPDPRRRVAAWPDRPCRRCLDLEEQLGRDNHGEPSQRGQSQEPVGDATGCHGSADDDVGVEDRAHGLPVERSELLAGFAGQSNAEGQALVIVEIGHSRSASCGVQSVECRVHVRQRIWRACGCCRGNASKRAQATTQLSAVIGDRLEQVVLAGALVGIAVAHVGQCTDRSRTAMTGAPALWTSPRVSARPRLPDLHGVIETPSIRGARHPRCSSSRRVIGQAPSVVLESTVEVVRVTGSYTERQDTPASRPSSITRSPVASSQKPRP